MLSYYDIIRPQVFQRPETEPARLRY